MITGNGKITWKVSWTFSITSDIAAGLNQLTIIFFVSFQMIESTIHLAWKDFIT